MVVLICLGVVGWLVVWGDSGLEYAADGPDSFFKERLQFGRDGFDKVGQGGLVDGDIDKRKAARAVVEIAHFGCFDDVFEDFGGGHGVGFVGCYLVRVIVTTTNAVGITRKQKSSKAVWSVERSLNMVKI
jgi:hypothetical protein